MLRTKNFANDAIHVIKQILIFYFLLCCSLTYDTYPGKVLVRKVRVPFLQSPDVDIQRKQPTKKTCYVVPAFLTRLYVLRISGLCTFPVRYIVCGMYLNKNNKERYRRKNPARKHRGLLFCGGCVNIHETEYSMKGVNPVCNTSSPYTLCLRRKVCN